MLSGNPATAVKVSSLPLAADQVKRALQQLDGIRSDGSRAAAQQAADVLLQQLDMCDMIRYDGSGRR